MKTIFQNQAIISYVEFIRKVIELKKDPTDEKTKELYHAFISRYREMKNDKEISTSVSSVHIGSCLITNLFKIYYVDMPQLWAFIHLVLEDMLDKELSLSFGYYKKDDFHTLKNQLKRLWFIKQSQYVTDFIYLEDENNKVDIEIKIFNSDSSTTYQYINIYEYSSRASLTELVKENCSLFYNHTENLYTKSYRRRSKRI